MNTNNPRRLGHTVRPALLTSLAAICVALSSAPTFAAEENAAYESTAKTVEFGDLNLSNSDGVKRLYERIANAARQVCDSRNDRSLQAAARDRICVQQSIARAVTMASNPALSWFYASKMGKTKDVVAANVSR